MGHNRKGNMRELKFRAWDKKNQEMRYGYPVIIKGKIDSFVEDITGSTFGIDSWPFELMQSTELTDKNGKEIYEGDIVKTQWRGQTGVIKWAMGGFALKNGMIVIETLFTLRYNKWEFEVIGNIYENPELLTT